MPHLRQSTVGTIIVGPALSNDTGTLALTNLTIVPGDVMLSKNGGAFAAKNHSGTAAHGTRGQYHVVLDATDTNTLGRLNYDVLNGTALPMWGEYEVIEAAKYDGIYGTNSIPVASPTGGTVDLAVQTNTLTTGTVGLAVQVNSGTVDRANSVPDPSAGTVDLVAAVTNLNFSGSAVDCNLKKVDEQASNDGLTWGSYFMKEKAQLVGTVHRSGANATYLDNTGGTSMVVTTTTGSRVVA